MEAYPRLALRPAVNGFASGRRHVLWRDQHGECIGFGNVVRMLEFSVVVSIELFDTKHLPPFCERLTIKVEHKKAGDLRTEPYLVCEHCQKAKRYLAYKGGAWKCKSCHGLVNRSIMIRQRVRYSEKLVKMQDRTGAGRPPGMHQRTYDKLCAERDGIIDLLGGQTYTANTLHSVLVNAEWLSSLNATGLPGESI